MEDKRAKSMSHPETSHRAGLEAAIIGMAGRFPQARSIDEFWRNLRDGRESISYFTDQQMAALGVPSSVYRNPNYVPAGAVLEDIDLFDSRFFGYSARESEIIDPQQRLFLECAWEAIEDAGYDPDSYNGVIGVYAGVAWNRYMRNLYSNPDLVSSVGVFQIGLGNDKDFLATRVSYKLNLEGPSITVQTACSTSLAAIHLACQGLLSGECDIALAGAVRAGEEAGYTFHERGIASPDGHCRAFDVRAQGTVGGNGVGVVVLKRLEDAIAGGDFIHAIIKGTAINNDGALKVGYTAPRVDGQAAVIRAAHLAAEVDPETVTYVEAHGTGTKLGDPIEVAALTRAFRVATSKKGFCAIGSVKTNIGHLDAAAGIAGVIKAVLALEHKMIPPSLHFTEANPKIDFANSPFYVNSALTEWKTNGSPRRAGVSSFGMGGTNAHVVLEEAPRRESTGASRATQLLVLSAKTDNALETVTANLADHLKQHPDLNLADVAHTLRKGRKRFSHRRILVCNGFDDALAGLQTRDTRRMVTAISDATDRPVAFMFSGLGDQYVGMARGIYLTEATFRGEVDRCCDTLGSTLGVDIHRVLYPDSDLEARSFEPAAPPKLDLRQILDRGPESTAVAARELNQTFLAQPILFVIEYALARLWMSWGVHPRALIGYSIGEYVAACLSGVFSLEDALFVVAKRARMIHGLSRGAMLAVPLSKSELGPMLGERLSMAAINGPSLCVIAGPVVEIDELQTRLVASGVASRRLHTTHAFHSKMMDPLSEPFTKLMEGVEMHAPKIPFVSNVTGDWIKPEEAMDPGYWATHACQPVRFADGIQRLWKEPALILLEVGPGQSLGSLALLHPANDRSTDRIVLSSLPTSYDGQHDTSFLLTTLGKLWLAGAHPDWDGFSASERRQRLPLPTYPFERQRYWIERRQMSSVSNVTNEEIVKAADVGDWIYVPSWKRSVGPAPVKLEAAYSEKSNALLFGGKNRLGERLANRLRQAGWELVTVEAGRSFAAVGDSAYVLNPRMSSDYDSLLERLVEAGKSPGLIVHLWSVSTDRHSPLEFDRFTASQYFGFYSLLYLAQALGKRAVTGAIRLCAITNDIQDVTGQEELRPENITILGPLKTIPQEYPNVECRSIDIAITEPGGCDNQTLVDQLYHEIAGESSDSVVAYRGNHRWVQDFEAVRSGEGSSTQPRLREGGVYLIVGGRGRIGFALAEHLARTVKAKLVLLGRSPFPARERWEEWLTAHGPDGDTSRKISKLQAIEQAGSEVLTFDADVAEEQQMRDVIAKTLHCFGALHGVIHAAGVVGERSFRSIQSTGEAEYGWHLRPKVQGLLVLERVLRGREIDFCILFSSLTSVLGGLGFTAYTAANLFIDGFACKQNHTSPTPWISLNSDAWRFPSQDDSRIAGTALGLGELALTPEEGMDVFRRALSMGHTSQVIVSTANLQARINRWIKIESLRRKRDSNSTAGLSLHARPNLQSAFVEPTSEIEKTLVSLWQELLGFEPISIDDNFFELGGHSLLIVQMISRLRDLLRTEIPMETLFETPTVAGLARRIEGANSADTGLQPPPMERASRDSHIPLSFAQQRLWFIDQVSPGNPAYNLENPVLIDGRLSTCAMEQTLCEIERRHEVLRTSFPILDGRPIQVIAPVRRMTLPVVDLSASTATDQQAMAKRLAQEEAGRSFDLAQGPLWRTILLRLGDEQHLALFTMHHIVSDAWSMDVLIREVSTLYQVFSAGGRSPLGEPAIQYADYTIWQRQWLGGEVLEAQLSYWKKQLAGSPALLELPTDFRRPRVQTFKGASTSFVLPAELAAAVKTVASQYRVTLFMTLLAGFQSLLHRYTGQDDIVVGSPVANRHRKETEALIGLFINPLILRTSLAANPTFKELLVRVREVTLGAQAHQDLPFELLVDALQPKRQTNYTPLFQVVFVLDHIPKNREEILAGLKLAPFEIETDTSPIDLHLAMTDYGDRIEGLFTYDSSLFDSATISEMAESLIAFLTAVCAGPEQRILDIPLRQKETAECAAKRSSSAIAIKVEGQFVFESDCLL